MPCTAAIRTREHKPGFLKGHPLNRSSKGCVSCLFSFEYPPRCYLAGGVLRSSKSTLRLPKTWRIPCTFRPLFEKWETRVLGVGWIEIPMGQKLWELVAEICTWIGRWNFNARESFSSITFIMSNEFWFTVHNRSCKKSITDRLLPDSESCGKKHVLYIDYSYSHEVVPKVLFEFTDTVSKVLLSLP